MKIVNKYILASCVFCYFAGIYMIADKVGFLRFADEYGIENLLKEWPEELPSLSFVWGFLAVYTFVFIIITYVIYRANETHAKETDKLQQQSEELHNYTDRLALKISQYKRFCKEKNIVDKSLEQRLDLLQKQLAALSPAVYKDNANVNSISRIVNEIGKAVGNLKTGEENNWTELNTQFKNLVEDYIDEVQRIRTTSITLK